MRWVTSRKLSKDLPLSIVYGYQVWNKNNEPKSGKEMKGEQERGESRLRKASLVEGERWETSNYQTGDDDMNDSNATSVASLCLTLSNSLKVLRVLAFGATSAYVQSFAAMVSQCVLLQSLTLHCMSSNYFLILFLPSFLLLILYHFLVLMKYNPGGGKTLDRDVASLFQALRRNKSITGLYVSDGKYGWMFYYTCELLRDCCVIVVLP